MAIAKRPKKKEKDSKWTTFKNALSLCSNDFLTNTSNHGKDGKAQRNLKGN